MPYPTGKVEVAMPRNPALERGRTGTTGTFGNYPFIWYHYQTPVWMVRGTDNLSVTTGVVSIDDVEGAKRAARAALTATGATA